MEKVILKMQHCYGISSLSHEFDFSNNNMPVALYAPNGMMKTSLAKSIRDYIDGKQPNDKIFPAKVSSLELIDENDKSIDPNSIFVIDSINEKYQSGRISTLLASENLKAQYDEIFDEIGKKKESFLKNLKKISGISKGVDIQFAADLGLPPTQFMTSLGRLEREVKNEEHIEYGDLKYKTIFNDKVLKFIENPDFENLIKDYTEVYERIIDNSKYFKKGVFNHSNAEAIAKNLKANGWFDGGHSVSLNDPSGRVELLTEGDLATAIEKEKEAILNNDDLKNMFSRVDRALSNAELKAFRDYLIEHPYLMPDFKDIKYLKNKIWVGYLIKCKDEFFNLIQSYDESEETLKSIITKAEAEQTRWEAVIDIFNDRFSVPFTVRIENKGDAVLNLASPQIAFYFNDENGDPTKKVDKDLLSNVLSNGEKRALYILNIIFEIEARRRGGLETLCIIDDIADSFDYKNKYAIVEYLWDTKESLLFHLVIMTHNFDFYRTIKGRLGIYGENKQIASKNHDGILVEKDSLKDNPFIAWKNNFEQLKFVIASIPFVRNIAEYIGDTDSYDNLTAILHIKDSSSALSITDIKTIFQNVLADNSANNIVDSTDYFLPKIFETCSIVVGENEEGMQLEKKIVLSIGIRLLAEKILISHINDEDFVKALRKNQTSKLIKKYSRMDIVDEGILQLMNQVQLMTPENIHINSFMFEPILDMSMHHLKTLYEKLSNENDNL